MRNFEATDPMLIVPPLNMPLKYRGGLGIPGSQRTKNSDPGDSSIYSRVSRHAGVDLLTDKTGFAEPVYAVSWGKIVRVDSSAATTQGINVTILHKPYDAGIVTNYFHLQSTNRALGATVAAGDLIGYVKPDNTTPHLHFELRRTENLAPTDYATITDSVPLDPSRLLYRFEALDFPLDVPQDAVGVRRKETPFKRARNKNYRRILKYRILPWRRSNWLFEVTREPDPQDAHHVAGQADTYFLPVDLAYSHEEVLMDVLRNAFDRGQKTKLGWRESFFFQKYDSSAQAFLAKRLIEEVRIQK